VYQYINLNYSLISDAQSVAGRYLEDFEGGNLIGVDPRLGPLDYYGGPTKTRALLPDSPAIDAGTNAWVDSSTDQRGESRISNGRVDMGAFEYQVVPAVLSFVQQPETGVPGQVLDPPVVVRAQDAEGVGASGITVELAEESGSGTLSGNTRGTTGPDGLVVFNELVLDAGGPHVRRATAGRLTPATSDVIWLSTPEPDPGQTTIAVEPDAITTDETAVVTVQLKDEDGHNIFGGAYEVRLETDFDFGQITEPELQDDGTYQAVFSATRPGSAIIRGTVEGAEIGNTAVVEVAVGAADVDRSSITASPTAITTDDSAVVTVQLKDRHGNARDTGDDTVEVFVDGEEQLAVEFADGVYTATFIPEKTGTVTFSGTVNGQPLGSTTTVNVTPG